jgi:hypothetical protein
MITGGPQTGNPRYTDEEAPGPINYYPEKKNNPEGVPIEGENPGVNHMANWMDCIRNRKEPAASVDVGYFSAIAVHMSNLAYRQQRRVTLEDAMSAKPEAWM